MSLTIHNIQRKYDTAKPSVFLKPSTNISQKLCSQSTNR